MLLEKSSLTYLVEELEQEQKKNQCQKGNKEKERYMNLEGEEDNLRREEQQQERETKQMGDMVMVLEAPITLLPRISSFNALSAGG